MVAWKRESDACMDEPKIDHVTPHAAKLYAAAACIKGRKA